VYYWGSYFWFNFHCCKFTGSESRRR
jgi:hypothetical protein